MMKMLDLPLRLKPSSTFAWMLAIGLCISQFAIAQDDFSRHYSLSDFGGIGLLQAPTARFAEEGEVYLSYSQTQPYQRYSLTVQALPWLESTLGYTRAPGAVEQQNNGDNSVDKRLDIKFRLLEESRYLPQLALGLRDLAGTGLFAGEYLVASKRWHNVDFSLGLGWGYLGSGGQLKNPFGAISHRLYNRSGTASGFGGKPEIDQWFRGQNTALFGGISYRTPIDGLSLKVELDPNDYLNEPYNNDIDAKSPLNVGLTYQPTDWLDLSVGFERGDTLMLQVALHDNLAKRTGPPKLEPEAEPLLTNQRGRVAAQALDSISRELDKQGQHIQQIGIVDGDTVEIHLQQEQFRQVAKSLGRVARVANNRLPDEIEAFRMINLTEGLPTASVSFLRKDVDAALRYTGSTDEIWLNTQLEEAYHASSGKTDTWMIADRYPNCFASIAPKLRQHIGGAVDTFYAYQLRAKVSGECALTQNLQLEGAIGLNLYNTFDKLDAPAASELPHVRSDIQQYLQQGKNGLEKLTLNYQWKPAPAWYARLNAGYLEEMYAGLGGEMLYRPYAARWAVGADLHAVKKRAFNKRLGLQDYNTLTGHATLYYDLPFLDLQTRVSVGRYLAGDIGGTLDISREFESGVRVGAFATLTDVSSEQFGEGSFDKGIYVSLPLDRFVTYPTKDYASFVWRPLTRDGGQKLHGATRLFDLTQEATPKALADGWSEMLD